MGIPADVMEVVDILQKAGHKAFLVGGCVRDRLLGREPKDYDVATSARPEEVARLFERVIPIGIDFGIVSVVMPSMSIEVATFRGDGGYTDGRRPDSVTLIDSIEEDLARRDLTINAIALDPITGTIVDPFRGQDDLNSGIISMVGDPRERLREDQLRALRAIRFSLSLGFSIEESTLEAIKHVISDGNLNGISAERKASELSRMLLLDREEELKSMFRLFDLASVFGMQNSRMPLTFRGMNLLPKNMRIRLALLLVERNPNDAEQILRDLRMSREISQGVKNLISTVQHAQDMLGPWSADVRYLLSICAEKGVDPFDVERMLNALGASGIARRIMLVSLTNPPVRISDLAINGVDLKERGFSGKNVGRILRSLLRLVIDDPGKNGRVTLLHEASLLTEDELP